MDYKYTIEFKLNCKLDRIYSYCDYCAYYLEDIKEDIKYLASDGFELIMDLGGWLFIDGDPYRYVSVYVYTFEEFSPENLLKKVENGLISFSSLTPDGDNDVFNEEYGINFVKSLDKELKEYIKNQFKKQIVELFL